ncbi:hypothetical protein [Rhizobium sp. Root1204]|uniref:hypothetical protein n=1 Tax=Rhizobium sp. Root1204 TaxID=1736428 RepID=UPI000714AD46|nr:hypothetical protein [Rhizobium sp. Root1204]KQV41916.1 hypothetical protein ASC96_00715 [Rhizobium sp. Root1204]
MARRRRKKQTDVSFGGLMGAVLLVLIMIGAVVGYFYLRDRSEQFPPLNAEYCPTTGPTSITAVLLDTTDPIADITKVDLKRQFQKTITDVERGGLIEVYALTDREGALTRTYRGCNPGDGADADELVSNRKRIQMRWEEGFNKPLQNIGELLGEGSEGKQSPIMAGIQRIVVESFSDAKLEDKPKTLIVASDMVEHTAAFSIYKSGTDYAAFEKSSASDKFRSPLDGVGVKVFAFQRENTKPLNELPDFWLKWVAANGGEWIGYERLAGVE